MLHTVNFIVTGTPVGKGRPRFTRTGVPYTPKETKDYEARIKNSAWVAMKKQRLGTSKKRCSVIISAVFPIPKSYSKIKVLHCQAGNIVPPRPDIDNIVKAALDACNSIVYDDDKQVWHISAFKKYTDIDEEPHLKVKVQWDAT